MDTMRDRFVAVTTELLDTDPRLAVVLADIGVGRFADEGAMRRHGDRIVNVGIREQAMIGVAAGMALAGFRPIVHSYAPFLVERPFEQLKLDLSHQDLGAVLVSVGASYDAAESGRTHQAPEDVAIVASLPGWEVVAPGHPDEVEAALRRAATRSGRVYLRLEDDGNQSSYLETIEGSVEVLRRGRQGAPSILAVGPALQPTLDATADLDVTLAYTITPHPLAGAGVRAAVTGTDVVVVEPFLEGTSAAAVVAALRDRPIRLHSIGVQKKELRRYGTSAEHRSAHGLDAAGLRRRLRTLSARRTMPGCVAANIV